MSTVKELPMKTYRITFQMRSPIAFTDIPIFDSILSYAFYCERWRKKTDYRSFRFEGNSDEDWECLDFLDSYREEGKIRFFLTSFMLFSDDVSSIERWRKRWDNRHDRIADFGKGKRKIANGSGFFKSYDMPLIIASIPKVCFYFKGNPDRVIKLLEFINGIGKKTKYGFGWFSSYKIEEVEDETYVYYRPLPLSFYDRYREYRRSVGSLLPPYWNVKKYEEIIIPAHKFDMEHCEGNGNYIYMQSVNIWKVEE